MGSKPSNAMQSKRPESGGTIKDDVQEQSGLRDRDKEEFAQSEQDKQNANASEAQQQGASHRITGHEDEAKG